MSCGSATSRVYYTASRPTCKLQDGPCSPCPVGNSYYVESAFKSAEPSCDTPPTLTPIQVATLIANKLDGRIFAPTLADGDAGLVTFPLPGVLAGQGVLERGPVATVVFSQGVLQVVCDVFGTGECGVSRLQLRTTGPDPSPNRFVELAPTGTPTSIVVTFANGSTHSDTDILRAALVGISGFFSA